MFKAKGRYVVAAYLMAFIYLPGIGYVYSFISPVAERYWYDIAYYLYFYVLMFLLLCFLFSRNNIQWTKMVSRPGKGDFPNE